MFMALEQSEITESIIGAAYEVHNVLGHGFLEKVYQRAMQVELQSRGVECELEAEIRVYYKGADIGHYKADLLVKKSVIVEIKAAKAYATDHEPQLLNELKATGIKVGLLINFGRARVEYKRFVF
jgi:GxxExxY protein